MFIISRMNLPLETLYRNTQLQLKILLYTRLRSQNGCVGRIRQIVVLHGDMFSYHDLTKNSKHYLRVKIRCDEHRLSKNDFHDRWEKVTNLVSVKGANLEWLI